MKKILSLLLLAAMLITAIPVMAAAAEETPDAGVNAVASEAKTPELYTLYTDRGLVALYTAFTDDGSVDLENGTWANKVAGGAAAILRDESTAGNYWTKYSMGIGYAMTYEQFKTNGDGRKVGITVPEEYYGDNVTVDAFAKVKGMTEEDGSLTVKSSEIYNDKTSAFRLGLFSGFFFANLRGGLATYVKDPNNPGKDYIDPETGEKVFDKYVDYYKTTADKQPNAWAWGFSSSHAIRWFLQNVGFKNANPTAPAYQVAQENGWLMTRGHQDAADTDQTTPVAAVMHLEKITDEGADRASTTITYNLTYNVGQQIMYYSSSKGAFGITATVTGAVHDAIVAIDERTDANENADGNISLFNGVPGEVYAIRVYADTLSDKEKTQNRFVDLLYYYGIKVPTLLFEDAEAFDSVAYMANDITIVADAAKSKATKTKLQTAVDNVATRRELLANYAATDALVAMFTPYDASTIDLAAGTWTDIVGNSVATLEGKTNWALRKNGAIGFDAWAGYMKDGVYTPGKTGFVGPTTAYALNKYRLLFDINMLPDEDFTVEYLATYRPLLIADGNKSTASSLVYYKENDVPLAAYDYAVREGFEKNIEGAKDASGNKLPFMLPQSASSYAGDMFGFFGSHTQIIDGYGGWGGSNAVRGTVYWTIGLARFGYPTNQQFLGGGWATTGTGKANGLAKTGDAYHVTGGETFNTYGVSVDETIVGEHTQAAFAIYRDTALYADNSAKVNSTANNAAADVVTHAENIYYYRKGSDGQNYYQANSAWYNAKTGEALPDGVTIVSTSNVAEEWGTAYYDCDYTELPKVSDKYERYGFWLSAGTPTDFLNVRVYNRVLKQAEKNQNRLADIKMYYGLELDAEVLEDEELVNQILYKLAHFSDVGLVTDASKKKAGKDAMEAIINPFIAQVEFERANDFASLYVKNSANGAKLVGLFSAIDGNFSADVTTGAWKNLVEGGADAIIRDTGSQKYWEKRDMGIGYTFHYKTAVNRTYLGSGYENKVTGVKSTIVLHPGTDDYISSNSDYDEVGIKLSDSYESFDNFTVEAFSTMVGATGDDGRRWERHGQQYTTISNFRFGLLGTCGFQGLWRDETVNSDAETGEYIDTVLNGKHYYMTNGEQAFTGYSGSSLALRWLTHNVATAYVEKMYVDDLGPIRVGDAENDHRYAVASVMQVEKATTLVNNAEGTAIDKDASSVDYTISYNNKTTQTNSWGDHKTRTLTRTLTKYEELLSSTAASTSGVNKVGRFTLFNDWASTVYAIRVYDGILTDAEKTQNRLADVMYYHGVEIPEGLADNAAALAAIAPVADTIVFTADATKMAANKATIEAAIAGALPEVTITVGGEEVEKVAVAIATYTLPAIVDGKAVVAYTIGEDTVVPGTALTLTEDVTAEATLIDAPKTRANAGLKITDSAATLGMRFVAEIAEADFDTIVAAYGIDAIRVGMLITPVKYVELAGGVFTREALDAMVEEKNSQAAGYVEVLANGFYTSDGEIATIAGSIYNFSKSTKDNDPAFTAVAFIDIDADRNGTVDYTIYGDNAGTAARVTDVAIKARPFAGNTQKVWIDNLLASFGA